MNQPATHPSTLSPGLPREGFVRIRHLIGGPTPPIPVSRATLWNMVKDGRFPKPVKLSGGFAAWPVEQVREWIDSRSH